MNKNVLRMAISAVLIAIGILIPMVSPVKIILGPMSMTLASHVAIMIAMFISPSCAVAVALGTTIGFLLAAFPLVVVIRALSHVIWAYLGAVYLTKRPETMNHFVKFVVFVLVIGVIHAAAEMLVVIPTLFQKPTEEAIQFLFVVTGLGTLIHGTLDYMIATVVWKVLSKSRVVTEISSVKNITLGFLK